MKTQLLSSDHGPRERLIDIKTGVSIKTESSPSFLSSAGSRKVFDRLDYIQTRLDYAIEEKL